MVKSDKVSLNLPPPRAHMWKLIMIHKWVLQRVKSSGNCVDNDDKTYIVVNCRNGAFVEWSTVQIQIGNVHSSEIEIVSKAFSAARKIAKDVKECWEFDTVKS